MLWKTLRYARRVRKVAYQVFLLRKGELPVAFGSCSFRPLANCDARRSMGIAHDQTLAAIAPCPGPYASHAALSTWAWQGTARQHGGFRSGVRSRLMRHATIPRWTAPLMRYHRIIRSRRPINQETEHMQFGS
jgi:hypothetical protein